MNFIRELDLDSILQCPVCMELPPNIIYMCKVGHHMCAKCRRRLTSCPSCQSPVTSTRNFLAEDLIPKFSIFKDESGDISYETNSDQKNADGAQAVKTLSFMRNNPADLKPLKLPEGIFNCFLESCHSKKGMGIGDMYAHVERLHPHLYEKNKKATFEHNFEDFRLKRSQRNYSRALHISNMGLFFLLVQFTPDLYMNCFILSPAPVCKTNCFDYGLEFVKKDCPVRLQFTEKVASTLQSKIWLLERAKVFILPPKKHLLDNGSCFSFHLKIVYNMPPL